MAIGVGLVLAALGLPLLWLASKEEANLWREAGVWLSLFAYAGILAGAIMDVMGMGDVLAFTAVGLGVIALPFTVLAFSQAVVPRDVRAYFANLAPTRPRSS